MILEHDLLINDRIKGLLEALPHTKRIIDVGCGIRPCPIFAPEKYVCIEPHETYRTMLKEWKPGFRVRIVDGTATELAQQPREDSTVLLIDVIEHMLKPDGARIRDLMMEFDHAVIFTPLGWYPQGYEEPDCWGLDGGFWQTHRSAWQPEDFDGWKVTVWRHWHPKNGVGAILATR